jgi:hypothetical protein
MAVRAWWSENLPRLGLLVRIMVYAALFFLLYAYWPKNIWDRPIGTLAAHEIITPIVFIILALFLIRALFNPADDDLIRRAWGWLGVVLIAASPMFASYILLR